MIPGFGLVALPPLLVFATFRRRGWTPATAGASARQEADTAPVEIGAGPIRERSLTVVGRHEYRASSVTVYGYVASATGLEPAQLFTDPAAPSAATARFTYVGDLLGGLSGEGETREVQGEGKLTIYFDPDGGASFDRPVSFTEGEAIANAEIEVRDVLQVMAPETGVLAGEMDLRQIEAEPFTLDGERFRFGHVGAEQRLITTGAMRAFEPEGATIVDLAGSAAVTVRAPSPAIAGSDGNGVEAQRQDGAIAACDGIEDWLDAAAARLARAEAIRAGVSPEASLDAPPSAMPRPSWRV